MQTGPSGSKTGEQTGLSMRDAMMGVKGTLPEKKVILIIIDSLRPPALRTCLEEGTTPALEYLCHAGRVVFDCVSVFPTMTPTASASIATGVYPEDHQIPGFIWYNREEKRIINYGATPLAIWKIGLKTVVQDLIGNLNGEHLSREVKTIHELLEDHGFVSANINFFTFRGLHVFKTRLPWWIRLWIGSKVCTEVWGPLVSIVGQLVPPSFPCPGRLKKPWGLFHKFGVNDEFAGTAAHHLIRQGKQPHLTVVYLPDTDGYTHRHHTDDLSPAIMRADQQVQKILNAYDSWKQAIDENVFVILGDHSQSLVQNNPDSIIKLPEMLAQFKQLGLGEKYTEDRELAVCPNERMAHIYLLKQSPGLGRQIVEMLAVDPRIDQIMWKEESGEGPVYHVRKGGTKAYLTFKRDGPLTDRYNCSWDIRGDLSVIDASAQEGTVSYDEYPDALNVMASLLGARHCGDITMTARLGNEFGGEAAPVHPGKGSHGSFHREDICVPLIITGSDESPQNPRVIDVVPFILSYFGLDPPIKTGDLYCRLT